MLVKIDKDGFVDREMIFEAIVDKLNEGVNVVDIFGNIVYSNRKSAEYVALMPEDMVGKHISQFYPQAALLNVLKTGKKISFQKVIHDNGSMYDVEAYPIYKGQKLIGGFAIFVDVSEITALNTKIERLEQQAELNNQEDIFSHIIGWNVSLKNTIIKAKKSIGALGGPRHSVIIGESGTGKTMLAKSIYDYAINIGVLSENAPFIEINCAHYTNSDIAAMEVFGTEEGAFTGARQKRGLFEQADGGILFLDEAHMLVDYQNMLLKVVESGETKRIGGEKVRHVNVIIIAASTQNLEEVFMPELYQRLAQYELYLPPLRDRTDIEKLSLLREFTQRYIKQANDRYGIKLDITFSANAEDFILNYTYPRNIRQFRDLVNECIDSAVPLINPNIEKRINAFVDEININQCKLSQEESPTEGDTQEGLLSALASDIKAENELDSYIIYLYQQGLGARRIANKLCEKGVDIKYYTVLYRLKKLGIK